MKRLTLAVACVACFLTATSTASAQFRLGYSAYTPYYGGYSDYAPNYGGYSGYSRSYSGYPVPTYSRSTSLYVATDYAPPRTVYATPRDVYVTPRAVYVQPAEVYLAPATTYLYVRPARRAIIRPLLR
jgi:hypothetical protein